MGQPGLKVREETGCFFSQKESHKTEKSPHPGQEKLLNNFAIVSSSMVGPCAKHAV